MLKNIIYWNDRYIFFLLPDNQHCGQDIQNRALLLQYNNIMMDNFMSHLLLL